MDIAKVSVYAVYIASAATLGYFHSLSMCEYFIAESNSRNYIL